MSVIEFYLMLVNAILSGKIFKLILDVLYALTPLIVLFTFPLFLGVSVVLFIIVIVNIVRLARKVKKWMRLKR